MEKLNYDVFNEITAGSVFSKSWVVLKERFLDVLIIVALLIVFQIPLASMEDGMPYHSPLLGILYFIIFYGPVKMGIALAFLHVVRGDRLQLESIFSVFKSNYGNILLASLLNTVIIGIGFAMLIVPGIIFAVRLSFVSYLVTEKQMDAVEAIKTSWEMTRFFGWQIFGMGLLCIPICIGGLILFGVGIIISMMWIGLAFALIYHLVNKKMQEPESQIVV